jgi:hypothetical protein
MNSIFDVPTQLILLLSLAASTAGAEATGARTAATSANLTTTTVRPTQRLQGPYRFSENVWLRALKDATGANGLNSLSRRIFSTSSGRLYVPVAAERRRILKARFDGAVAGRIARAFAESNARLMGPAIGRKVSAGDLYIAHLFGPEGAVKLIKLASENPRAVAVKHAPHLARSLPQAFYLLSAPLTLADVYGRLTQPLRDYERNAARIGVAHGTSNYRSGVPNLKPTLTEIVRVQFRTSTPAAVAWERENDAFLSALPVQ